jgi:transcriptional regulator with XRE-family HTH domain
MKTLADRLDYLLKRDNITAYELSSKSGLNEATISRLLNGKTQKPNIKNIEILAKYFHVTRQWLLTGKDEYEQKSTNQTIDETNINPNYKQKTTTEMKHVSNEERIDRLLDQNDKLISMLQIQVNTINNLSVKVKEERSMGEASGRRAI